MKKKNMEKGRKKLRKKHCCMERKDRRGSVGETRGKIMVGELCLFEGHNYKIRVIGDS